MGRKYNYKAGDIINDITFLKYVEPYISNGHIVKMGLFRCKCGKEFICLMGSIVSKNTKSCGCYGLTSRSKRFKTHGLSQTKIYKRWKGIKTRCYNKNRNDYKYYGGRGIVLSDEFHDFNVWYNYVKELPNYLNVEKLKLTIDRIDAFKNYERGNLRWATRKEQSLNQRRNS